MAKLYVLVRNDMPKNYQAVQAGHAVAQFVIDFPNAWRNETLVYLRVANEDDILAWNQRFAELGVNFALFQEPDWDDQITAIAVESTEKVDRLLQIMRLV